MKTVAAVSEDYEELITECRYPRAGIYFPEENPLTPSACVLSQIEFQHHLFLNASSSELSHTNSSIAFLENRDYFSKI